MNYIKAKLRSYPSKLRCNRFSPCRCLGVKLMADRTGFVNEIVLYLLAIKTWSQSADEVAAAKVLLAHNYSLLKANCSRKRRRKPFL